MVDEIMFTPLRPVEPPDPGQTGGVSKPGQSSFKDMLADAIRDIDQLQNKATESIKGSFDPTNPVDLHQVMIAMEEANIAFQFAMEVRNQLVDGYNELLRMNV